MIHRRTALSSGLIVLGLAVLDSAPARADVNPVGHWKLDDAAGTTAIDSSGHAHTGTLANSPVWATGRVNGGLSFNGTSPIVTMDGAGNLTNLHTTGFTVSAWINPISSGASNLGRIVEKHNTWFFGMNSGSTMRFVIDQYSGSPPKRLSGAPLTLNAWQHVAVTWNGATGASNIHFFVNGAASDGAVTEGTGTLLNDASAPLSIGNRPELDRGFNGAIDDVRIYNRVLSAAEIQALADSVAPTAPGSPAATAASSSQINLSWTASTDNVGVTGYRVERCLGASCTTFAEVGTPTASPYSSTGLAASSTYRFRVRATDANTNLSSYSSIVSATTTAGGGDVTPPSVPGSVTATAVSSTQVNLSWSASTDNVAVTGYLVERCQGASCTTFAQIATPTTTSYNDTGRTASTTYRYRVRARDAVPNYSGYSSIATATTPAAGGDTTPPSTPTGLTATPQIGNQNALTWNASTDNVAVTGYLLERCAGTGCSNFAQIATPPGTTYTDTGLVNTTHYRYRVRARDAIPNYSGYSNISGATPADCD